MCMCSIGFLLLLSCATTVMKFSRCTSPPCISWMILMTLVSNKLNIVPCLVACFFFLRYFSDNIPSVRFFNFGFRLGVIGFFQLVAGVRFHSVEFVLCFCHRIICVCCNISGVSVGIVTVSFCTIFSGVGDSMIRMGYPYRQSGAKISSYLKPHENFENVWVISSGAYVQKWRTARDFIIDSIIHIHMYAEYIQKRRNARDFYWFNYS